MHWKLVPSRKGQQERSVKAALKRHMRMLMNIWAPFLGAGIRVKRLGPDWKEIDVEMKLRWWNANYVGTHYGGSLYSMTDPFFMLMLIENLGKDYIVWASRRASASKNRDVERFPPNSDCPNSRSMRSSKL